MSHKAQSPDTWDSIAGKYDGLWPDQSLADPSVRAAWKRLYAEVLPERPLEVLDAGCGTGSLALALAELGHRVTGIDFSPAMIEQAQAKNAKFGKQVSFSVQDAVSPNFPPRSFDLVTCRQVLWALPDRGAALSNWENLLRPNGWMVLIEGLFASGNGMSETELLAALPDSMEHVLTRDLSNNDALWGRPLEDHRYLFVARRRTEKSVSTI